MRSHAGPGVFCLQILCCLSLALRLFCFVFVRFHFFAVIEAAALRSIFLRHACVPAATRSYRTTIFWPLWFRFFFISLEVSLVSLFQSNIIAVSFLFFSMESTFNVFPFRMVFFYLVTTGWILTPAYVRIHQSTDEAIRFLRCVYLLPSHSFWKSSLWTYQPGSRRRKATHDFSTFFLRCLP